MADFKRLVQALLFPFGSWLKVPIYRAMGATIGEGAEIAAFSVLMADKIEMGPGAQIKPFSLIVNLSRFQLGAYSMISSFVIIHGTESFSAKGRAHVGPGNFIDVSADVELGEFAGLAPRVTIMSHHSHRPDTWGYYNLRAPVVIGDLVSVGFNTKIGHGVTIADGTQVVPNSTVLKSIKSSSLCFDSPLKRIVMPVRMGTRGKVTREMVENFIRESALTWARKAMAPKGYRTEEEPGGFFLIGRRKTFRIHFFEIGDSVETSTTHFLFGSIQT